MKLAINTNNNKSSNKQIITISSGVGMWKGSRTMLSLVIAVDEACKRAEEARRLPIAPLLSSNVTILAKLRSHAAFSPLLLLFLRLLLLLLLLFLLVPASFHLPVGGSSVTRLMTHLLLLFLYKTPIFAGSIQSDWSWVSFLCACVCVTNSELQALFFLIF